MKTRLHLAALAALDVSLTMCGRYGGGVGGWVAAISQPMVDATRAQVRRNAAVEACQRALRGLAAAEHSAAVLDVLKRLGATLEGAELGPMERTQIALDVAHALDAAVIRGLAFELEGAAHTLM